MLECAFPFEHGPALEVVGGHLGEDRREIDLAIADGAEAPCPLDPGLEAAIDTLPTGRVELGVLDVKSLDAILVDVDVVEIIELLQHEVARIIE
ncbi:hypothetical protein D3C87_1504460 [compost metagenome]